MTIGHSNPLEACTVISETAIIAYGAQHVKKARMGSAHALAVLSIRVTRRTDMRIIAIGTFLFIGAASSALAQDPAAGEKVFAVCRTCHQIGENAKNALGPVLNGLIGRKAGSVEGYDYSAANKASGITWDEATFREYIKDPQAKIPGTKMAFAGIKDEKKINDLIAFLKQFGPDGKKTQ